MKTLIIAFAIFNSMAVFANTDSEAQSKIIDECIATGSRERKIEIKKEEPEFQDESMDAADSSNAIRKAELAKSNSYIEKTAESYIDDCLKEKLGKTLKQLSEED